MKKRWISLLISGALAVNSMGMIPVGAADLDIPLEGDISGEVNEVVIEEEDVVDDAVSVEEDVQEGTVSEIKEIPIDEAHFPDPEFRFAIKVAGFDKDRNNILSEEELKEAKELYTKTGEEGDPEIKDLAGIEYLPYLEELHIWNSLEIKTLDLSKNLYLKELNIWDGGNLEYIDASENSALKSLILRLNVTATIALPQNNQIEDLAVDKYSIKAVKNSMKDFKALKSFWWSDLEGIPTDLDDTEKYIDLSEIMDFSWYPELEEVRLWGETFANIDFSHNPKLKSIRFYKMNQNDLNLKNNTALKYLDGYMIATENSSGEFIHADNSTLDAGTGNNIITDGTISLDENHRYDLSDIPGYQADRIIKVKNAEIEGDMLYPSATKVTIEYYINDQRDIGTAEMRLNVTSPLKPAEVKGLKITKRTSTTLSCKWDKLKNVDGYVVYARNEDTGKNEKRVNVKKKTSYKLTGLKAGGRYAVIVRGYKKIDGKNYYSFYGDTSQEVLYTLPVKPTLKVTSSGSKLKFTWNNKRAASPSADSGYLIYYSTKKNSGYQRLALVPDTKGIYTTTKLKKGETYYFKMRAYVRTKRSDTTFSGMSNIVRKSF